MTRSPVHLALVVSILLGCSARTDLDPGSDETETQEDEEEDEEELPECTADLTPRVEDCARPAAPDAVPIATLFTSRIRADESFLYFSSEGRAFRLAMSGGEPEALTPPDSVDTSIRYVADGFLYWIDEGTVLRVATTGGEPEPLVEIAPGAVWALADEDIFWAPYNEVSPVFRTSTVSGETTELFAEDPEESIKNVSLADDHLFVTLDHTLVAVPLDGNDARVLVGSGSMSGAGPVVHNGQVYFGANLELGEPGIWSVDLHAPSAPELFLSGFPVVFVVDDDALYAHIIPENPPGGSSTGRIVRAPLSGGDVIEISDTSSRSLSEGPGYGPYITTSHALVVSGCNMYFVETCSIDPPSNEYRLVTMSKVP
jgi:hypothetical protein